MLAPAAAGVVELVPVYGVVFEDEDLVEEDFEEDVVDWWICETSIG